MKTFYEYNSKIDIYIMSVSPSTPSGTYASIRATVKANDEVNEPHILIGDPNRLVILPLQYPEIQLLYKKAQACIWTMEEIDLAQDITDWNDKLNNDERHFLKKHSWVLCRQ